MFGIRCSIIRFFSVIVALTATSRAAVKYDDVAVIVNTNSVASKTIGAYFQTARGIPSINIICISAPEQEVIDDAAFSSLRTQIETYLTSHNLTDSINYLVTTKGVPLKVNREPNGDEPFSLSSASASVESELSLILGTHNASIGMQGRIISPYFNAGCHFTRSAYGFYLVTRLDGYTTQDVLDLIDRGRPGTTPDQASLFVFDQDPDWNSSVAYLNTYMADAASQLSSKGKHVRLNNDSIYVTYACDVLGYTSWGSNDHYANAFTQNAKPHISWAPGAIAETYVSTSARSFNNPPVYGQSLIADLIAEGISGAKGYVYEPYSSAMAVSSILFNAYTGGYNLAESFYQSSVYLSWMDVIIGDPKTSIDGSPSLPLPVQLSSVSAAFDISTRQVAVQWTTQSEIQNYGFYVQRRPEAQGPFTDIEGSFVAGALNSLAVHTYSFDETPPTPGRYEYRLRQVDLDGLMHYSESVIVSVNATTGNNQAGMKPLAFRLEQNYPNPFNPTTIIGYTIAGVRGQASGASDVRLAVYDLIGHEVAVLVDEKQAVGTYEVTFDGARLPSGMYLSRLEAGGNVSVIRMILLK